MQIQLNGIHLFYEVKGTGRPLILLHGNGETRHIFDALAEKLSKTYQVYAVDSRSHGESDQVPELSYESIMEDITALIRTLQLEKPVLYGFSDGGIAGLMLAAKYPDLLSCLIVSGANLIPSGIKKRWLLLGHLMYFLTGDVKLKLMLTQPHILDQDLLRITVPVLLLAGEKDLILESHTRKIAGRIKNSELKILPGENHGSYVVNSDKLYPVITEFLEKLGY